MTYTDTESLTKKELIQDRSTGLGGTDISCIFNSNPWRSAVDVYQEKVGEAPVDEKKKGDMLHRLEMGNRLESTVIDVFESRYKIKVQRDIPVIRHKKYPFLLAHVDGLIDLEDGGKGVFEAKTAGANAIFNKSWGKPSQNANKEDIPVQYYYQIQWYMTITNRDFAYLAVLLGGVDDFRVYRFDRNYDLSVQMRKKARRFWTENVQKKQAPEPMSQKDSANLYPRQDVAEYKNCSEKILRLVLKDKSIRQQMKTLFTQKDRLDAAITAEIGQLQGLKYEDRIIATWKENSAGKRLLKLY